MRILITTPFFMGAKGGIGLYTQTLSRHLARSGHDVVVVTPYLQNIRTVLNNMMVIGVKSFYLPGGPFSWARSFSVPYRPLSLISSLRELVREFEIDLLHTHGQKYLITWISVDVAFRMKLPSLLEIHGTDQLRYYGAFAGAMDEIANQIMFRETTRKVSAVLCTNETELEYWSKYCDGVKFFKYTQGIDVARFTNALKDKKKFREEYDIPLDKKVVLFLGRLEPVKGVLELMGAVKGVTRKFDDAIFLIVGRGPLTREIRKHAEAYKEKVVIIPWVPHSQVQNIYALSDVFVLPTKAEGQPHVRLEAMASQLHIVTTAVGGVSETLAGYPRKTYIKECSPLGISNALIKALDIVSKTKRIEPTVQSHIEKFDWSHAIAELETVYNLIIGDMQKR